MSEGACAQFGSGWVVGGGRCRGGPTVSLRLRDDELAVVGRGSGSGSGWHSPLATDGSGGLGSERLQAPGPEMPDFGDGRAQGRSGSEPASSQCPRPRISWRIPPPTPPRQSQSVLPCPLSARPLHPQALLEEASREHSAHLDLPIKRSRRCTPALYHMHVRWQ